MSQGELLQLIDQAAQEGWTELDLSNMGLTALPPENGCVTITHKSMRGKEHGFHEFADFIIRG